MLTLASKISSGSSAVSVVPPDGPTMLTAVIRPPS
jgi:hypothetical protein